MHSPLKVVVMPAAYVIPSDIVAAVVLGPVGFKLMHHPDAGVWLLRLLLFHWHVVIRRRR